MKSTNTLLAKSQFSLGVLSSSNFKLFRWVFYEGGTSPPLFIYHGFFKIIIMAEFGYIAIIEVIRNSRFFAFVL